MYRRRRYTRGRKFKYNVNNLGYLANATAAAYSGDIVPIIDSNTISGVRKVARISLNCAIQGWTIPITLAVIYVPEGMSNPTLHTPTTSVQEMLQPSQNVMLLTQIDNTQVRTFRIPLKRNMNQGDKIMLIVKPQSEIAKGTTGSIQIYMQYAICYV